MSSEHRDSLSDIDDPDADLQDETTVNEEHGQTNQDGATEAFEMIKPFVISSDQCPLLKDRLTSLGVTNLSHIALLQENDFNGIISPIQFRTMQQKFKSNKSNSSYLNGSPELSVRYNLDLKSLLSSSFYRALVADTEILTKHDRRKLIASVGDDMVENLSVIRQKEVLKVATTLVKAHPTSLGCLMKDEIDIKEASSVLCNSILGHIYYLKSISKGKRTASSDNREAKRLRFSKAESNGLDPERDLPNSLPVEETSETQEAKRKLLAELAQSGTPVNWASVKKMMSETYYSQRGDINDHLSMEKLLAKWPFIGKLSILQDHFETLKDVKLSERMGNAVNLFDGLQKFFEIEAHRKRKGKSADIPSRLKEILKKYSEGEENSSKHYICIILCCIVYMDVPEKELFVLFEETASFDEIQASANIPPHPVIAVLGNNVQDNPHAYILVDKRIISEVQVSVSKALNAVFMCYYVFKIAYPTKIAPILHFIQRKVFGIEDEGTKTQRIKTKKGYVGAPPLIPHQLLTLLKNYKAYCSEWNIDY